MSLSRDHALEDLQSRLSYRFMDLKQLEMALTHRSWVHEKNLGEHYERAEFLGDAVLGLIASEWLYRTHTDLAEGELSRLKSHVVSEPVLAEWASGFDLGAALRLGVGEDRSGGRTKKSLLADAMESVLGAVYLDGGLESVRSILEPLLVQTLGADHNGSLASAAKSELQELIQSQGIALPEYRHVAEEGPDHRKRFHVECWVEDRRVSVGSGATKKEAEQAAAHAALGALSDSDN